MSYEITHDSGKDVIVVAWFEDFDSKTEFEPYNKELKSLLDQIDQPVGVIFDMTRSKLGIEDVISAANSARREDAAVKHPNVSKMVVVAHNKLIQTAAKGMNSLTFGNMNMDVVATREEAIQKIAEG